MHLIEIENLTFGHRRNASVLTALNLCAGSGEVVGLLGANGAGKTTLFRLIVGLLRPPSGAIRVAGVDVRNDRREASRHIGYVPDETLLYPKMSALENVNRFALLWGVSGVEARVRGERWLKEADLWRERDVWVEAYSRGMRQRLAVVCALLHQPSVLVLDEPFNGLDLGAALWLRKLLRARTAEGDCVLVSSHQPDALDAISDRLAVLHGGSIAREFERAELTREGGSAKVFCSICRPAEGAALDERTEGAA